MDRPPDAPEPQAGETPGNAAETDPMGERLLQQAFELWIQPEIERRRQAGGIADSFELRAAQVIFDADADAPEVRLNGEVKAILRMRAARPIQAGEPVTWADVSEVVDLELTDKDPNAGHLTLLLKPDGWWVGFDFRYNAARIAEVLGAGTEFLDCAASALQHGYTRAFIDNLFSAAELLAKAILLSVGDKRLVSGANHRFISARYNLWGKLGNVPADYVRLLNALAKARPLAHYLQAPYALDPAEADRMLATARDMLTHAAGRSPTRAAAPDLAGTPRADGALM